jgi:pimeloyl-ACP methyl ester carboxylesterase
VRTADGRRLAYATFGVPDGRPVLFFHGTPGNRHADYLESWGRAFGIQFVVPERPGFGASTFQRNRRLLDWPADVVSLLDHLDLPRATVMGVSGGGPYSLACGYMIPERVESVLCISSVPPPGAPLEGMSASNQKLLRDALTNPRGISAKLALGFFIAPKFAEKFVDKLPASMPEADKRVRTRPDVRATFLQAMRTVRLRDARGAAYDFHAYAQPWGFSLSDIRVHVELWQGADDDSVPLRAAQHVASLLPDCTFHAVEDAGHLLVFERWHEILSSAGFAARPVSPTNA